MKTLIVYDSVFGNTKRVAEAMAKAVGAEAVRAGEAKREQLHGVDLLIAGSPTRAFTSTKAIKDFLRGISAGALKGVKVTAFDTRACLTDINSKFLNFMVGIFGYAAEPMLKTMVKKGGTMAAPAEGFFVKESEGPMKDGEIERAAMWAKQALNGEAAS